MKDISLLVIKPEVARKQKKVVVSLKKRGYAILLQRKYDNWPRYARRIYTEFRKKELNCYLSKYIHKRWKNFFYVLLVHHKKENTVQRLKKEKGNYISYQSRNERTLRAEFGLSARENVMCGKITFVYCGIHCPAGKKEFLKELQLFKIKI